MKPVWLLALILTISIGSSAGVVTTPARTASDFISALERTSDPDEFRDLFYEFQGLLRDGNLSFRHADAAPMARCFSRAARDTQDSTLRSVLLNSLRSYPHPAAADNLIALINLPDAHLSWHLRLEAISILVDLGDSRAVGLMSRHLHGRPRGIQRMLDLLVLEGSRAASEVIETLLEDENLGSNLDLSYYPQGPKRDHTAAELVGLRIRAVAEIRKSAEASLAKLQVQGPRNLVSAFKLDSDLLGEIDRQGFAIRPSSKNELYEIYGETFPYITVDLSYHTFLIMMRAGLRDLELHILAPKLRALCSDFYHACLAQADLLGPELSEAALHNAASFALASQLGGVELETSSLSAAWRAAIAHDLTRIQAAAGIDSSRILGCKEDFSEYSLRSSYAEGSGRSEYFRQLIWLGRAGWPANDHAATIRALLLIDILHREPELLAIWSGIEEILQACFGNTDDPNFRTYMELLNGTERAISIARDPDALTSFMQEVGRLPVARINDGTVQTPHNLRVIGQRYGIDSDLLQQSMAHSWPVSGMEVAADLMGSERARSHLPPTRARHGNAGFSSLMDSPGILQGTLYCAQALFTEDRRRPAFMSGTAWGDRKINSALGLWADARNALAPYQKSAHQYIGLTPVAPRIYGGVDPYPEFYSRLDSLLMRTHDIFESQDLYSRIEVKMNRCEEEERKLKLRATALRDSTSRLREKIRENRRWMRNPLEFMDRVPSKAEFKERQQERIDLEAEASNLSDRERALRKLKYRAKLDSQGLTSEAVLELSSILKRLTLIAQDQLQGEHQSPADGEFLKRLGRRMRHLSFNRSSGGNHADVAMSCIIDVAVEYQSGDCLEVGVGRPLVLYVALPEGNRRYVCRGAIYSYHEFLWPSADRLNDDRWREMTGAETTNSSPPWLAGRGLVPWP